MKLPPQAIDIEESVLGAILIESKAFGDVVNILNSECFYKKIHAEIFTSCLELYKQKVLPNTIDFLQ